MGTQFRISFDEVGPNDRLITAAQAAFREVGRIERLMSEWRADSEVSAINAMAGIKPQVVSQETFAILKKAQDVSRVSSGAFDITWAAMRGLWRFSGPQPSVPSEQKINQRLALVGFKNLVLDDENKTAFLKIKGMSIGLGAIAKGYAIDRAAQILRQHGFKRFIMDGGGDLYLSGRKRSSKKWSIGIRHPRIESKILVEMPVENAAIVTSGDYERYFERGGKRFHHIIDLKTGQPAQGCVSVTVMAADATLADAYATAIFVLGPQAGIRLAQNHPNLEAAVLPQMAPSKQLRIGKLCFQKFGAKAYSYSSVWGLRTRVSEWPFK